MNETGARLHDPAAAQETAITVTVLYFARLREVLGRASETVALPAGPQTVTALRAHLRSRGGGWEAELAGEKPVRVAVNQDMAQADTVLADGDEVAFFPPVTGG
jgi:molybdopterin synthase sulfur carrier subunit